MSLHLIYASKVHLQGISVWLWIWRGTLMRVKLVAAILFEYLRLVGMHNVFLQLGPSIYSRWPWRWSFRKLPYFMMHIAFSSYANWLCSSPDLSYEAKKRFCWDLGSFSFGSFCCHASGFLFSRYLQPFLVILCSRQDKFLRLLGWYDKICKRVKVSTRVGDSLFFADNSSYLSPQNTFIVSANPACLRP